MRCIVTGGGGFAGSHLCEYLKQKGEEILALDLTEGLLEELAQDLRPDFIECDLLDRPALRSIIRDFKPDVLFHLAGISFVPRAGKSPGHAVKINITGSIHILESVRIENPAIRTVMISSGAVYGRRAVKGKGFKEDDRLEPENFYALTKESMEAFTRFYCRTHGVNAIVLRPFNHIGPRQSGEFVASSFAKQIAEILELGRETVIKVGNLEAKRDFTDVRDMVAAYDLAARLGSAGDVFNLCSGIPVRISDLLRNVIAMSGRDIRVETDQSLLRRGTQSEDVLFGDPSRFVEKSRWRRQYTLEQTMKEILAYWQKKIQDQ